MRLEDDPGTMGGHDSFFQHAMRQAYHPLNAIEQAALLPLKEQYAHRGQPDLMWALVRVLREDGVAQMHVLTIERVEQYGLDYSVKMFSTEASTEPD